MCKWKMVMIESIEYPVKFLTIFSIIKNMPVCIDKQNETLDMARLNHN